jgi:hypothetical protein
MLAEMYFLRLEALMRALEEAPRRENSRFVPLPRDAFKESRTQAKGKDS